MKRLPLLLMALTMALISTIITSCSSADEPQTNTTPDDETEVYEVSLNFVGDFVDITEEPLARATETPKTFYGINVYCMKTNGSESSYSHYAYGVFDNKGDMKISLLGGYKYKFECTSATEGDDKFSILSNKLGSPFYTNSNHYDLSRLNLFTVSPNVYLTGLKFGETATVLRGTVSYPRMDRYYGELADFIPTTGGVATIPLKRTAFGLRINLNGVPDGSLTWSVADLNNEKTCTGTEPVEVNTLYTFYEVYNCWKTDSYTQEFTIEFTWTRTSGNKQQFNKVFTAKRNVLTTININLTEGNSNISLGLEEENAPMGNEEIDIDYDGGDTSTPE